MRRGGEVPHPSRRELGQPMEISPSKSSILGALSQALDLVEGQPEGHALRAARLAMRIGREIGLPDSTAEDLFFASVIKDSGCSNNSVRIQKIFGGDELLSKRAVKFIDWTSPVESVKFAFKHTERGQSMVAKLRRMASNLGPPKQVMIEVTEARCTRGAEIARMLGFSPVVADAVRNIDEHWDGNGAPFEIRQDEIPLLARIICLTQTFEVFATTFGVDAAYTMMETRCGTWFDPDLVQACRSFRTDTAFWNSFGDESSDAIADALPHLGESAMDADIDKICEAFALIIDAKSSFTSEHSARVTQYALQLGHWFGIGKTRLQTLRRAGLLHDIGKLGVSTGILEKPGKLDDDEFAHVKLHPKYSFDILKRVPSFDSIAELASAHHERLDGRGYWRGLAGGEISLDVRILTTADVFDALTAERPYRAAMSADAALVIMERDRGTAFDPDCLDAVRDCLFAERAMSLAA